MENFVKNTCFLVIFITASVNVDLVQSKFLDFAKIEDSLEKQALASTASMSSRFLDLGVISQLFSGFNQGSAGGAGSLNLPPYSQFYPGDIAQKGTAGSNFGQGLPGNNQIGGFQYQQPSNQPNQQGPGQQGQNVWQNNQNNNFNPRQVNSQSSKGSKITGRLTTVRNPNQGFGQGPSFGGNEGTLDDFFTTTGAPALNKDHRIIFPDESGESTTRASSWGKPVPVPKPMPDDKIIFSDSGETPSQRQCVQSCSTTSEYNPVCGSDNVTYFNPGRLVCARNCGINVFEARSGSCRGSTG